MIQTVSQYPKLNSHFHVWTSGDKEAGIEDVRSTKLDRAAIQANPFLHAISRKMRGVCFSPWEGLGYLSGRVSVDDAYIVWYEGDLITCGVVATGHRSSNDYYNQSKEDVFMTFSQHIRNGKYGENSDGQRMLLSISMATAVKNATRYLRRPSVGVNVAALYRIAWDELQRYQKEMLYDLRKQIRGTLNIGPYDAVPSISKDPPAYVVELVHMHNAGHEFLNSDFAANLKKTLEMEKENNMLTQHKGDWYIFYADKDAAGNPKVVQLKMLITGEPDTWDRSFDLDTDAYLMDPEEVSEEVQGKVAVLSMVEDSHYVQGVGVRLRENCFYINI